MAVNNGYPQNQPTVIGDGLPGGGAWPWGPRGVGPVAPGRCLIYLATAGSRITRQMLSENSRSVKSRRPPFSGTGITPTGGTLDLFVCACPPLGAGVRCQRVGLVGALASFHLPCRGTRPVFPCLIIVARDQPGLLATLTALYGHVAGVEIRVDRRRGQPDSWRGDPGNRRSPPSLETDLRDHGFIVIPRP